MVSAAVAALALGAAGAAGLVLVVLGVRPVPVTAAGTGGPRRALLALRDRGSRVAVAALVALVVGVLTRWPAGGIVAGLVVWGVPYLFTGSRRAAHAIVRIEAVEDWLRRLADVLVVGVGLGQAVVVTSRSAPEPVRPQVTTLASRVAASWPLEDALRAFAADIDDASADLAVAALLLAQRRRGPGLAAALVAIADALGEEVAMRRGVEADRARPRTTARAVTVITLAVVGIGLLTGGYLAPYATPLGQLVLLAIAVLFAVSLGWMHAMTLSAPRPRLLAARSRTEEQR